MRGRPQMWTYDKVMETAARCRTWREFYSDFPHAYDAAQRHGWLAAAQSHCGMVKMNGVVIDVPAMSLSLQEILEEDGCLFRQAIEDPTWPIETTPPPLKEEIL